MPSRRSFLRGLGTTGAALALPGILRAAKPGAGATVTIACAQRLGDAKQISDFLGAGGGLYYVSTKAKHPVVQAWRRVGFQHITFETLHAEDKVDRWLTVKQDRRRELQTDFSLWDRYLRSYRMNLRAEPFVYLGNIPRALSSEPGDNENYAIYPPRDIKQWQRFVTDLVRHNVEKLDLRGLTYASLGEPDHEDSWRLKGIGDPAIRLREHVKFYAATYRAVKAGDPNARFGAPATMNWKETKWTKGVVHGIEEWIRELARYNANPGPHRPVGLDYISWQDYGWASDRISDGAEAVSRFLAKHGLDPKTPKMLAGSGWGSWSSDYLDESIQPHQRGSHVIHNIIREFKDPRRRQFALALYFYFHFNEYWLTPELTDGENHQRVALVWEDKRGKLKLTPIYAAFQMVKAMNSGDIVETIAPQTVETMATRDDKQGNITCTINNHRPESTDIEVVFRDLPFTKHKTWVGIQRIDAERSMGGKGLEQAEWVNIEISKASVRLPLNLAAYGTAQMVVWPDYQAPLQKTR